jgi:hypothetical protein
MPFVSAARYIRSRILFMDPKWICQLRYFLGTKFDHLFGPGPKAQAKICPGEMGIVNCMNFEETLQQRLVALANYVQYRDHQEHLRGGEGKKPVIREMDGHPRMELRYETTFVRIETPTAADPRFYSILETAKRHQNPTAAGFNKNLVKLAMEKHEAETGTMMNPEQAEKVVLEKKVEKVREQMKLLGMEQGKQLQRQPFGRTGPTEEVSPEHWAQLEFEGKVLELQAIGKQPLVGTIYF